MIEVADNNAAYYYHFDALGSVVAFSDSSGDTVQKYQYTVFGEVWVSDIDHPNPYMFAGVRFDIEIGLYYNRARYYNPFAGRFLQTDPIGYSDGMNLYRYCGNNPLNLVDPRGLDAAEDASKYWGLGINWDDNDNIFFTWVDLEVQGEDIESRNEAGLGYTYLIQCSKNQQGDVEEAFRKLDSLDSGKGLMCATSYTNILITVTHGLKNTAGESLGGFYDPDTHTIKWNPEGDEYQPAWLFMGHELIHATHYLHNPNRYSSPPTKWETAVEETQTYGVKLIEKGTNKVLLDCTGDRITMRTLADEAGIKFIWKDLIWSDGWCPRHRCPRSMCPVPH